MTTTTIYKIMYSYNAGYLGTERTCKTEEDVNEFTNYYVNDFKDSNKSYTVYKITTKKFCGIKIKRECEEIAAWWEN
jgi:hypothetical protein